MSFITPEYVIFFSVVIPLFFTLRHRMRWVLLLLMSYFFYAYGNIQYLPLIAFSTIVDYIAAQRIHANDKHEARRRLWLLTSVGVNLGVLFFFKYFNFANDSVAWALRLLNTDVQGLEHSLILPIGISFYTFQSMSYTIDVFRRKLKPERHLGIMATYVAFFPQLVAGPIERATNLLPQFHTEQRFNVDRAVAGFQQILWGFFKKVVIADRVAIYVNTVYNNLDSGYTGQTLLLATAFFGIQIYCDFSGYSDIAIGTARIMGFDLMENFRQPYFAQSVREFWGRWHISLSTWFRDYLYIPLGGNRVSLVRNLLNLMIVFVVSGLWHGAGWTFVIWGALHGLLVAGQALLRHLGVERIGGRDVASVVVRVLLTFAFVNFAWIFFRANSFADALYVVQHLFVWDANADPYAPFADALLDARWEMFIALSLIAFLAVADLCFARWDIDGTARRLALPVRWTFYYALGAAVIFSGLYSAGAQQFIYFQF